MLRVSWLYCRMRGRPRENCFAGDFDAARLRKGSLASAKMVGSTTDWQLVEAVDHI